MMMSSETRPPASITVLAAQPSGVPALTAARSMSPVEICGMPNRSLMNAACVPLPAPGGPSNISRIPRPLPALHRCYAASGSVARRQNRRILPGSNDSACAAELGSGARASSPQGRRGFERRRAGYFLPANKARTCSRSVSVSTPGGSASFSPATAMRYPWASARNCSRRSRASSGSGGSSGKRARKPTR